MRKTLFRFLFLAIFVVVSTPVIAGEFYVLGGVAKENLFPQRSYSFGLEYLEGLGEHLALSISYLNQGHFDEHHLDGDAVSLWARTNLLDRRLSLAAGAGPFLYYDTTHPHVVSSSTDDHGLGGVFSLTATLYTESRFLVRLRANWIKAGDGRDSESVLLGLGYQLDPAPSPGPLPKPPPRHDRPFINEVAVLGGETAVNYPAAGHSFAAKTEYRRLLLPYLEWTGGYIYEQENSLIDRTGPTTQLWLTRTFFDDRLSLGAGAGGYFAIDNGRRKQGKTSFFIAPMFSMTGSYSLTSHWQIRTTWDRIITTYDRDADLFLGGLGYRF